MLWAVPGRAPLGEREQQAELRRFGTRVAVVAQCMAPCSSFTLFLGENERKEGPHLVSRCQSQSFRHFLTLATQHLPKETQNKNNLAWSSSSGAPFSAMRYTFSKVFGQSILKLFRGTKKQRQAERERPQETQRTWRTSVKIMRPKLKPNLDRSSATGTNWSDRRWTTSWVKRYCETSLASIPHFVHLYSIEPL